MNSDTYSEPVKALLQLGEKHARRKWMGYLKAYGFTEAHIPELIRMAIDQELNWGDSDSVEVWAPVHAWRALGQLKAEAAIEPLLSVFNEMEDSDWFSDEMPEVFALIGPAALSPAIAFLADAENPFYCRWTAAEIVVELGKRYPELRAECVAALEAQLERHTRNSPELNGVLVGSLLKLDARESAPVMERAYAAKWVDHSICGDWLDVQLALKILSPEEVYERRHTVDAEQLLFKAPKLPASTAKGFSTGTVQKKQKKKGK